jgi:iron complex transport system substrate-binding protein
MKQIYTLLMAIVMLASCSNSTQKNNDVKADSLYLQHDSIFAKAEQYSDTIEIHYAKGLNVEYKDDGVHVKISNPDPSSHSEPIEIIVKEPKQRFICMTALQLSNFAALGLEHEVVGMNSLRHLFNPTITEQMQNGKTVKIGKEGNFDIETVIASRPDYIFVSDSKHGGYEALKDCGIPLIPHHGYKETDPLGQAEWMKLVGLLTGETRRANAVFADIEHKYNVLQKEVAELVSQSSAKGKVAVMPTVISGRQIRDGWYVMGGASYMARIFRDAGADYIMKDREETGGITLDFESVYAKAVNADFWQIDGSFEGEFTLDNLRSEDERYADLSAFKNKKVLFCNFAVTPYRELSPVEPHILLADFVKAFHPEILPHYTPKYYKLMK